jgi:CrcB protein
MSKWVLIAVGGGLGAVLRAAVGVWVMQAGRLHSSHVGTFLVNLVGCGLAGLISGWFLREPGEGEQIRAFFVVGLLGGFTTFSAFSVEFLGLVRQGHSGLAFGYVAASVIGGLLACAGGWSISGWIR